MNRFENKGRYKGEIFRIDHYNETGQLVAMYDGYWDWKTNTFKLFPQKIYRVREIVKAGTLIDVADVINITGGI